MDAFDDYGPTALATFTDGTSNTALAGEVCRFTNDGDTYQQFWTIYGFFGSVNGGANPSTRGAVGLAFQVPLPNQPFQPEMQSIPTPARIRCRQARTGPTRRIIRRGRRPHSPPNTLSMDSGGFGAVIPAA